MFVSTLGSAETLTMTPPNSRGDSALSRVSLSILPGNGPSRRRLCASGPVMHWRCHRRWGHAEVIDVSGYSTHGLRRLGALFYARYAQGSRGLTCLPPTRSIRQPASPLTPAVAARVDELVCRVIGRLEPRNLRGQVMQHVLERVEAIGIAAWHPRAETGLHRTGRFGR